MGFNNDNYVDSSDADVKSLYFQLAPMVDSWNVVLDSR